MAACTEEIVLIDAQTNIEYKIELNREDAEKARNDTSFASRILGTVREASHSSEKKQEFEETGSHSWTQAESLLLINLYKEMEETFYNGKISRKVCWNKISDLMKEKGYSISGTKCANKFQQLRRTYKSIKDHNAKSGNSRKTWEYFDTMEDIFAEKPWIKPLATANSIDTDEQDEVRNDKEETQSRKQNKRRLQGTLEKYLKESIDERKIRREEQRRQHEEKMELLKELTKALQTRKQ